MCYLLQRSLPSAGWLGLPHLFRLLFVRQTIALVLREPEAERGKQRSPQ